MSGFTVRRGEPRDIDEAIHIWKEGARYRASISQARWDEAWFTPEAVQGWIDTARWSSPCPKAASRA